MCIQRQKCEFYDLYHWISRQNLHLVMRGWMEWSSEWRMTSEIGFLSLNWGISDNPYPSIRGSLYFRLSLTAGELDLTPGVQSFPHPGPNSKGVFIFSDMNGKEWTNQNAGGWWEPMRRAEIWYAIPISRFSRFFLIRNVWQKNE